MLIKFQKIIPRLCLLITLCGMNSCEKFVETDIPVSRLSRDVVFESSETAYSALASIYHSLRNGNLTSFMSVRMGFYSDELQYSGTESDQMYFQNGVIPSDLSISSYWNSNYKVIYNINSILDGVQQSSTIPDADKRILEGEALFLRAFVHFYLTNLFGNIPYVTTTDYRVNTAISKKPVSEVYASIVDDLDKSKTLLDEQYPTAERVRLSKNVVRAMLARVHLYMGSWQTAATEATAIIDNTEMYPWADQLDGIFLKGSMSTIWQLMSRRDGDNTNEAQSFIFVSVPTVRSLNSALLNAFEPGDLRKEKWIGSVSNNNGTWYYAFKYKKNNPTPVSEEYSIVFRLEEMYLIRAEARVHQNDPEGAKEDVNKIRLRAGLDEVMANTEEELLQAIWHERQVELFSEYGHRWLDLKRTGQANVVLPSLKQGWDATDTLLPLPQNEILINPNIRPQNTGY